ncbi:MAG TPA: HD domain-containing phosphohydrolase [Anaerolineaceae bacterium]
MIEPIRVKICEEISAVPEKILKILEPQYGFSRVNSTFTTASQISENFYDLLLCPIDHFNQANLDWIREKTNCKEPHPLVILAKQATIDDAVQAIRTGAADFLLLSEIDPRTFADRCRKSLNGKVKSIDLLDNFKPDASLLNILLKNTIDLIYVKNNASQFVLANEACAEALGLASPQDMIGKTDFDFFPAEFARRYRKDEEKIFASGQPMVNHEEPFITTNGSLRWKQTTKVPLIDHDGKIIGLVGIGRDITERKNAHLTLQRANLELETRVKERTTLLRNEMLERRHEESLQKAMYHLAEAAIVTDDLESLYKEVHRVISSLMDARNFYISLLNEAEQKISFPYLIDEEDYSPRYQEYTLDEFGHGLTRYMLELGEPLMVSRKQYQNLVEQGLVDQIGAVPEHWLGAPLKINDRTIGAMVVQTYTANTAYSEKDRNVLAFVSSQVAMAIQRKQAEAVLRDNENKFRQLFERSSDAMLLLDGNHFTDCNQAAAEMIHAPSRQTLTGMTPDEISPPTQPDGMNSTQKARLMIQKALEKGAHRFEWIHRRLDGEEFPVDVSLTAVTLDERRVLYTIWRDITEQKRAQQRVQQQVEQLAALRSIDDSITSSHDLPGTLNILLDFLINRMDVDAATVLLFQPQTQSLDFAAGKGFKTNALKHTHLKSGEGLAGKAAAERRIVMDFDLDITPESLNRAPLLAQEGFITYIGVPLISKDEVRGILEIFQRRKYTPAPDWLEFITALAAQAAIAIDNATLFRDLQSANTELLLAYDATIEGWARALELRDQETEGHSKRVVAMTLRLATEMGFPDEQLMSIRIGALLHDIGKMGIPDQILLKPGRFDPWEMEVMRRHPTYAYELLAPISFLRSALDIPYCHHEKWDGSGYPRGLKGEEIPLPARIFAVVDVWDALMSERPYRKAWNKEQVIAYIREQSGIHFDPTVVDLFMKLIDSRFSGFGAD